jgi:hypothetical protein
MALDRRSVSLIALSVVAAGVMGYVIARANRVDPIVITQEPRERIWSPRGGRVPSPDVPVNTGAPCLQPSPQSGLVCQNGEWVVPAEEPRGGGGPWRTSGCVTPPPAEGFRCQDGVWTIGGTAPADRPGGEATPPATPPAEGPAPRPADPGANPTSPPPCAGPPPATAPGSSAACVGGTWIIR